MVRTMLFHPEMTGRIQQVAPSRRARAPMSCGQILLGPQHHSVQRVRRSIDAHSASAHLGSIGVRCLGDPRSPGRRRGTDPRGSEARSPAPPVAAHPRCRPVPPRRGDPTRSRRESCACRGWSRQHDHPPSPFQQRRTSVKIGAKISGWVSWNSFQARESTAES